MIFLKLGGSLITEKTGSERARPKTLRRIANEIAEARAALPETPILVGHGSGSFGHRVARKYGTAFGAISKEDWLGYAAVWRSARRLHEIVLEAFIEASLPVVGISPSASALCRNSEIETMATQPFTHSLAHGLLPLTHGDVAMDELQGACIISTEQVLGFLAKFLQPTHLLLAGIEDGVYAEYPARSKPLSVVSEEALKKIDVGPSAAVDVTGGMQAKVQAALELSRKYPDCKIQIFSGENEGVIRDALLGHESGTLIQSSAH